MVGTPWFWRIYIAALFAATIAMRVTGWELPSSVRRVALPTVVGLIVVDLARQVVSPRHG